MTSCEISAKRLLICSVMWCSQRGVVCFLCACSRVRGRSGPFWRWTLRSRTFCPSWMWPWRISGARNRSLVSAWGRFASTASREKTLTVYIFIHQSFRCLRLSNNRKLRLKGDHVTWLHTSRRSCVRLFTEIRPHRDSHLFCIIVWKMLMYFCICLYNCFLILVLHEAVF